MILNIKDINYFKQRKMTSIFEPFDFDLYLNKPVADLILKLNMVDFNEDDIQYILNYLYSKNPNILNTLSNLINKNYDCNIIDFLFSKNHVIKLNDYELKEIINQNHNSIWFSYISILKLCIMSNNYNHFIWILNNEISKESSFFSYTQQEKIFKLCPKNLQEKIIQYLPIYSNAQEMCTLNNLYSFKYNLNVFYLEKFFGIYQRDILIKLCDIISCIKEIYKDLYILDSYCKDGDMVNRDILKYPLEFVISSSDFNLIEDLKYLLNNIIIHSIGLNQIDIENIKKIIKYLKSKKNIELKLVKKDYKNKVVKL